MEPEANTPNVARVIEKIYLKDNTYRTIQFTKQSTTQEIKQMMIDKEQIDPNTADSCYLVMVTVKTAGGCKVTILKPDEVVYSLIEHARDPENLGLNENDRFPVKLVFNDSTTPLNFEGDEFGLSASQHYTLATPLGNGIFSSKLSKKSKNADIWKQRWFVLEEDCLLYCQSEDCPRHVKAIPLAKMNIKICNQTELPYCFIIETNERDYILRANTPEIMTLWVNKLKIQSTLAEENEFLIVAENMIADDEYELSQKDQIAVQTVSGSLKGVLKHDATLEYLARYMRSDHCEENLYFWLDVESYKEACEQIEFTNEKKWRLAQKLYDLYLNPEKAKYELYINDSMRSSILEELGKAPKPEEYQSNTNLSPPSTTLYDQLQHDIYNRIEKGPYKKFMKSNDYRKIINLTSLSIPIGESNFTPTFISPLLLQIQEARAAEIITPTSTSQSKPQKSLLSLAQSFFSFK